MDITVETPTEAKELSTLPISNNPLNAFKKCIQICDFDPSERELINKVLGNHDKKHRHSKNHKKITSHEIKKLLSHHLNAIQECEAELETLKNDLKEKNHKIENWERKIHQKTNTLSTKKLRKCKKCASKLARLKGQVKFTKYEVEKLRVKVSRLENTISDLYETLSKLREQAAIMNKPKSQKKHNHQ